MIELALLNEARKSLDHLLDRMLGVDACTLKEIKLLSAMEGGIDVIHARAEILRPTRL